MDIRNRLFSALAIVFALGTAVSAASPATDTASTGRSAREPRRGSLAWYARPVTSAEEQQAIAFLRQINAERVPRLERMRTKAPPLYNVVVRRIIWTQARLAELAGRDTAGYARQIRYFQLESTAQDLGLQYRETSDPAAKQEVRARMIEALGALFEMRESEKRAEIQRLEERLAHLRNVVEEREHNREQIVTRRAQQLLGELEMVEW